MPSRRRFRPAAIALVLGGTLLPGACDAFDPVWPEHRVLVTYNCDGEPEAQATYLVPEIVINGCEGFFCQTFNTCNGDQVRLQKREGTIPNMETAGATVPDGERAIFYTFKDARMTPNCAVDQSELGTRKRCGSGLSDGRQCWIRVDKL